MCRWPQSRPQRHPPLRMTGAVAAAEAAWAVWAEAWEAPAVAAASNQPGPYYYFITCT